MRPFKMIGLGLLVLPAAEIAAFVGVASLTGLATAVVLLILASVAGILVLRNLGGGAGNLPGCGRAAGRAEVTAVGLDGAGIATGLGGILLAIPGFITGLLGALVIFPLTPEMANGRVPASAGVPSTPRGATDHRSRA